MPTCLPTLNTAYFPGFVCKWCLQALFCPHFQFVAVTIKTCPNDQDFTLSWVCMTFSELQKHSKMRMDWIYTFNKRCRVPVIKIYGTKTLLNESETKQQVPFRLEGRTISGDLMEQLEHTGCKHLSCSLFASASELVFTSLSVVLNPAFTVENFTWLKWSERENGFNGRVYNGSLDHPAFWGSTGGAAEPPCGTHFLEGNGRNDSLGDISAFGRGNWQILLSTKHSTSSTSACWVARKNEATESPQHTEILFVMVPQLSCVILKNKTRSRKKIYEELLRQGRI